MNPIPFDNTYARLPDRFFARLAPTQVREPRLIKLNHQLAEVLGLDAASLNSANGSAIFAGNVIPEGSEPMALAYAGHQFGGFVPQLGDGRAILLGEVVGVDGKRRDIQLKGSGRTPFSRGGDGRAALGPVLREYIVSEFMAALGIPTTRTLAAVTTGEPVYREEILPGAILTRVASSHMRIGTFQYFAARNDQEALGILASYALRRHFPDRQPVDGNLADTSLHLLKCVIEVQAELIAQWLGVGFIHGVMNTDNTSIAGETIDYGPCAFVDEYDPLKKFSSIDHHGRYALGRQPSIAQWNLARLAETLLPLIASDPQHAISAATERLNRFPELFDEAYGKVMRAKLGLRRNEANDPALIADLLNRMASSRVDYTVFFRGLCDAATNSDMDERLASLFEDPTTFASWAESWRQRLLDEDTSPEDRARSMRLANPAFTPRNHQIEMSIAAAMRGDYEPFEILMNVLARPCDDQPEYAYLAEPPSAEQRVRATFCGT